MGQRHSEYERDGLDWYVEPEWCVHLLFDNVRFSGPILDPACGSGTIVKAACGRGLDCSGSDIVDRGGAGWLQDWLSDDADDERPSNIATNPPFRTAVPFIQKSLERLAPFGKAAFLLPLTFLSGQKRREELFLKNPPALILILSRRPSMPPGGSDLPAKGGSTDFCWIVWEKTPGFSETRTWWLA